jgi:hypothetical protein
MSKSNRARMEKSLDSSPDETVTIENGKLRLQKLETLPLVEDILNQVGVGKNL